MKELPSDISSVISIQSPCVMTVTSCLLTANLIDVAVYEVNRRFLMMALFAFRLCYFDRK